MTQMYSQQLEQQKNALKNHDPYGARAIEILYYKILSVCVSVCVWVCLYVSMLVRNRLPNHAYYDDEAFAGDSAGQGLGRRLNFI